MLFSQGAWSQSSDTVSTTIPDPSNSAPPSAVPQPPAKPLVTKPAVRPVVRKKSRDSGVRFGFGMSYAVWQSWIFNGGVSIGAATGYSAYVNLPAGMALEFDARYLPRNSLGFMGGLSYDLSSRSESGGRYGTADASAAYDAGRFAISITTLNANLAWRGGAIYYPFGLNYSMVKMSSSYYTGGITPKGGIGWNLGVGYYLGPNFNLELLLKSVSASFSGTGTSNDTFDKGTLLNAGIVFKYVY